MANIEYILELGNSIKNPTKSRKERGGHLEPFPGKYPYKGF